MPRNNKYSIWSGLSAAIFCLLLAVSVSPILAQTNPLPAPQAAPPQASAQSDAAIEGATTAGKKNAKADAKPNNKSATADKKLDFGGAIADLLAANPECAELTNNCQICIRRSADNTACSQPGIACAQGTWTCTKTQAAPKLAQ